MDGLPAQQFLRVSAGGGRIGGKAPGQKWILEVGGGFLRRQRGGGYPENSRDEVRDRLKRDRAFSRAVQSAARRRLFEGQAKESGRVLTVDRGPSIRAVTDICRDARSTSGCDQKWDEPVVSWAVNGWRQPHDAGSHSLIGEGATGLLARHSKAAERLGIGRILLGAEMSGLHHQRARCTDERLAGPSQGLPKRVDRRAIPPSHILGIGEIAAKGHMDDAAGGPSTLLQDVEILQRAAQNVCPVFVKASGRLIGSCQSGDGVAGRNEFSDDRGTGKSGAAGNEDVHSCLLLKAAAERAPLRLSRN